MTSRPRGTLTHLTCMLILSQSNKSSILLHEIANHIPLPFSFGRVARLPCGSCQPIDSASFALTTVSTVNENYLLGHQRCPYIVFRNRFLYGFMFVYIYICQDGGAVGFVDFTKLLFALSSLAQPFNRVRSIPEHFSAILSCETLDFGQHLSVCVRARQLNSYLASCLRLLTSQLAS